MTTYKIKYSYETGNSFGREDAEGMLEMEWKNLDNAKTALERIKEHYNWYKDQHRYSYGIEQGRLVKEPAWHKELKYDFQLKVLLDNGNEVQFIAPWCGYFERLYGAEIVTSDNGMSFEI